MVEFLRTNSISSKIDEIIIGATQHIIFLTPYLNFPKILYERLTEKSEEGIPITFVYGKVDLHTDQDKLLKGLKNISIHYLQNLHAKCYMNENAGIVTSMNLIDYSQKNNREMGIYFEKGKNDLLYKQVKSEVDSIIKASIPKHSSPKFTKTREESRVKKDNGGSLNQKLLLELKKEYPNFPFNYNQMIDTITCSNFGQFFLLNIEPKGSYFRIDFRVTGDSKTMISRFDFLYNKKDYIQKMFPLGIVNWGPQMKRIKLDFPLKYNPFDQLDDSNVSEYLNWVKMSKYLLEGILVKASNQI